MLIEMSQMTFFSYEGLSDTWYLKLISLFMIINA